MADTPDDPKKPEAPPPAPMPAPAASPAAGPKPAAPAKPRMDPVEEALRREVPSVPLDALKRRFPEAVLEVVYHAGEVTVVIPRERVVEILRFLHDDDLTAMNLLCDLTAVDWPKRDKRFDVVYHLYSIPRNHRLRLKVRVGEGEPVPSATPVHHAAEWHEREVFDLFGVAFDGHPDLRRILLPDEWKGHPLRKEYPLEGFPEQHMRLR